MKHFHLFLFLFILCHSVFSQEKPLDISKLRFSSAIEEKAFKSWDKDHKINNIELLLCLDSSVTQAKVAAIEKRINDFIDEKLRDKKGKTNEKTIKNIFTIAHDAFLQKYVEEARFDKLFETGEYNCLTASALFALIFDRLQIPYQLRTTETHAYVVAYPGDEQVVVETTNPTGGVMQYNDDYKKGFVSMLQKDKFISASESKEKSIDELFWKYYYKADTVEWSELIGDSYYNDAVFAYQQEQKERSLHQMLKAYTLNQQKKAKFMLILTLALEIDSKFELTDSVQLYYYGLYQKLNDDKKSDFLYAKFYNSTNDIVFRNDNLEQFEKIGNYLVTIIPDSIDQNKITEHIYLVKGSYYTMKKEFKQALENFLLAISINPKNVQAKAFVKNVLDQVRTHNYPGYMLSDTLITTLENFTLKNHNKQIASALSSSFFYQAGQSFEYARKEEAKKLLTKAEMYNRFTDTSDINHKAITYCYSEAYRSYSRDGETSSARSFLVRGISTDASNEELKKELKTFDETGYIKNTTYSGPNYYPPAYSPPSSPVRYYQSVPSKPRTVVIKSGKK